MEQQRVESSVPVGSPDGSDINSSGSDYVSQVRNLLFRRMLVGIKDGRFFLGAFHCIDKQGNIILQDAVEYRSTRRTSPSPMEQRCLGACRLGRRGVVVQHSLAKTSIDIAVYLREHGGGTLLQAEASRLLCSHFLSL